MSFWAGSGCSEAGRSVSLFSGAGALTSNSEYGLRGWCELGGVLGGGRWSLSEVGVPTSGVVAVEPTSGGVAVEPSERGLRQHGQRPAVLAVSDGPPHGPVAPVVGEPVRGRRRRADAVAHSPGTAGPVVQGGRSSTWPWTSPSARSSGSQQQCHPQRPAPGRGRKAQLMTHERTQVRAAQRKAAAFSDIHWLKGLAGKPVTRETVSRTLSSSSLTSPPVRSSTASAASSPKNAAM